MNNPGIFQLSTLLIDHQREQETMALLDDLQHHRERSHRSYLLQIIKDYYSYASPNVQIRLLDFIKGEVLGLIDREWRNYFIDMLAQHIDEALKLALAGLLDHLLLTEMETDRIALMLLDHDRGTQRAAFIAINESMGAISNDIKLSLAESLSGHPDPGSTYIYDLLVANGDGDLLEKYL